MAGSIEDRGNGKYLLVVSAGRDPVTNKRKKHTRMVTAKSPRQAEKLLAKFVTEVESGMHIPSSKQTFLQFANEWLERQLTRGSLAPKTHYRYKGILEQRIYPIIGSKHLEKVTVQDCNNIIVAVETSARKDGKKGTVSPATIQYVQRVLHRILGVAYKQRLIPFNPAAHTDLPPVKKTEKQIFTLEEVALMLDALKKEDIMYQSIVWLAIDTGGRRGEIAGLMWDDIEFLAKRVKIRRSVSYVPGQALTMKTPKTESSVRSIIVSQATIDVLARWKQEQDSHSKKLGDKWIDTGFVFTQWDGSVMHPDTPTKWFPKFLAANNLPHLNFHGLRHLSGSILLAKGLDIVSISKRLGHSSPRVTQDIYLHSSEVLDAKAADIMDNVLTPKPNKKTVRKKA